MWLTWLMLFLGGPIAEDGPFKLTDCSFMAGSWSAMSKGLVQEEHWMRPSGGVMVGMHRDVWPNGKSFFEYLRIEQRPDGIYYLASPRGKTATPFKLVATGLNRAVFENPEHDFPQRIIYSLDGGDLIARIEGSQGGKQSAAQWRWSPTEL